MSTENLEYSEARKKLKSLVMKVMKLRLQAKK